MAAQVNMPMLGYVKAQLIVNSVIVFLMLVVVTLRVVGRLMGPGLGWDDAFVVFCAVSRMALARGDLRVYADFATAVGSGHARVPGPLYVSR